MTSHTPLSVTEAERLERERFDKWSPGQFVLDRDEKSAWRAWLARAIQQTAEPVAIVGTQKGGVLQTMYTLSGIESAVSKDGKVIIPLKDMPIGTALYRAVPDRAPSTEPVDADALSALLWLYHRLPHGYERQDHIERSIKALAARAGTDVESDIASRIGSTDRAPSTDSATAHQERSPVDRRDPPFNPFDERRSGFDRRQRSEPAKN